jgi:hypothetical protein
MFVVGVGAGTPRMDVLDLTGQRFDASNRRSPPFAETVCRALFGHSPPPAALRSRCHRSMMPGREGSCVRIS